MVLQQYTNGLQYEYSGRKEWWSVVLQWDLLQPSYAILYSVVNSTLEIGVYVCIGSLGL